MELPRAAMSTGLVEQAAPPLALMPAPALLGSRAQMGALAAAGGDRRMARAPLGAMAVRTTLREEVAAGATMAEIRAWSTPSAAADILLGAKAGRTNQIARPPMMPPTALGPAGGAPRGRRNRMLVHAPSVAICWTTYEAVKRLLDGAVR